MITPRAACSNCGAALDRRPMGTLCMYCRNDGAIVPAPRAEGAIRREQQVVYVSVPQKETHGAPALLSFFIPGLGQLVKGQVLKGIGTFAAMGLSFLLIGLGVGLVTTPILWILQIWDAYADN